MTGAQAATLREQVKTAQKLAIRIYAKYTREGIAYKQLKAPAQAIKANARRVELARELIHTLNALERKYYAVMVKRERERFNREIRKQWKNSRHVSFTVYTNGR